MTLCIVTNKEVLSLPALWRRVLQHCYEPDKLSAAEIRQMQESVINWKNHFDYKSEMNAIDLEQEYQLGIIAKHLQDDMNGEFDHLKKTFKEHGIDWRKYYRLPEAMDINAMVKAQENYEKLKRKNPEENS